ncbi:MAG TPA: S-adenosylmethionine decarboxylase [Acidimicrobiales bacterium]|nr:S-adenosylmethionine decarboxylase [Acidimicrobiales bacterium]
MLQASSPSFTDDIPDLAPMICRQRLVVEGIPAAPIDDAAIKDYLLGLSELCEMKVLLDPVTHESDRYGWAGWIHWEASGVHVYAWESPILFFSVDIYTCKPFDMGRAVDHTRVSFGAREIVAKAF